MVESISLFFNNLIVSGIRAVADKNMIELYRQEAFAVLEGVCIEVMEWKKCIVIQLSK